MSEKPFYFSEGPYLQIMQSLYHGLTNGEAFILLMGDAGVGKSALCEKLSHFMARKGHEVLYIDESIDSPEILRTILADQFDLPSTNNISRFLEDSLELVDGQPHTLIFDNAHLLSDISLIEIHRLSEIQVNSKRALNIVLAGDVSLEQRIHSKTEFASLRHNVSNRLLLRMMTAAEQFDFLKTYLAKKNVLNLHFDEDAASLLYRYCKGYPEAIGLLSVLIADAYFANPTQTRFDKKRLAELIGTSELQAILPSAQLIDVDQLKILMPVAAVLSIAILGYLFQLLFNDSSLENESVAVVASSNNGEPAVIDSPFAAQAQLESLVVAEDVVSAASNQLEAPNENLAAQESVNVTLADNSDSAELVAMPSLLRPAPMFSLDDEEPVSDSSLALVTAAEIGLDVDSIERPVYEDFEQSLVDEPRLEPNDVPDVNLQQNSLSVSVSSAVIAKPAQTMPQAIQESAQGVDTNPPAAVALESVIADSVATDDITATNDSTNTEETRAETEPAIVAAAAEPTQTDSLTLVRLQVDRWISAWQDKNLEGYFASYDPNFEPRYESSVSRWQQSRTRVIGNAAWIKLQLSEYSVVLAQDNTIEVNFWLDYESPTYSDSTLKKIVLSNTTGNWLILEEVNLRVRS